MKTFYIETDRLTIAANRVLRFVYSEDDHGAVNLRKVIDPLTSEEFTLAELKIMTSPAAVLNMQTAYLGSYHRTYL